MKLERRDFVKHVGIGLFTASLFGAVRPELSAAMALPDDINMAKDPDNLKGLEVSHIPKLTLPMVAEDGRVVPIEVSLDHPMEKDHYIKSITVIVLADPIASKGQFQFTPLSGKPYFKFQSRMAAGTSPVYALVECNKHGRWVGHSMIRIVGGGC
jgi:sulfur-oxidizing protein SoxY